MELENKRGTKTQVVSDQASRLGNTQSHDESKKIALDWIKQTEDTYKINILQNLFTYLHGQEESNKKFQMQSNKQQIAKDSIPHITKLLALRYEPFITAFEQEFPYSKELKKAREERKNLTSILKPIGISDNVSIMEQMETARPDLQKQASNVLAQAILKGDIDIYDWDLDKKIPIKIYENIRSLVLQQVSLHHVFILKGCSDPIRCNRLLSSLGILGAKIGDLSISITKALNNCCFGLAHLLIVNGSPIESLIFHKRPADGDFVTKLSNEINKPCNPENIERILYVIYFLLRHGAAFDSGTISLIQCADIVKNEHPSFPQLTPLLIKIKQNLKKCVVCNAESYINGKPCEKSNRFPDNYYCSATCERALNQRYDLDRLVKRILGQQFNIADVKYIEPYNYPLFLYKLNRSIAPKLEECAKEQVAALADATTRDNKRRPFKVSGSLPDLTAHDTDAAQESIGSRDYGMIPGEAIGLTHFTEATDINVDEERLLSLEKKMLFLLMISAKFNNPNHGEIINQFQFKLLLKKYISFFDFLTKKAQKLDYNFIKNIDDILNNLTKYNDLKESPVKYKDFIRTLATLILNGDIDICILRNIFPDGLIKDIASKIAYDRPLEAGKAHLWLVFKSTNIALYCAQLLINPTRYWRLMSSLGELATNHDAIDFSCPLTIEEAFKNRCLGAIKAILAQQPPERNSEEYENLLSVISSCIKKLRKKTYSQNPLAEKETVIYLIGALDLLLKYADFNEEMIKLIFDCRAYLSIPETAEAFQKVIMQLKKCIVCLASQKSDGTVCSKCGGCKLVYYCSKTCQLKHWPTHKSKCEFLKPITMRMQEEQILNTDSKSILLKKPIQLSTLYC